MQLRRDHGSRRHAHSTTAPPLTTLASPIASKVLSVGPRCRTRGLLKNGQLQQALTPYTPKFTVTFFRWVKLSSMPSRENSRPMPDCLTPP
jgi:hypothetical protein